MEREELLGELLREVRAALDGRWERDLPSALTMVRAAAELSISVRKLRRMVAEGEVFTCEVGKVKMIPRSEIERLTTPQQTPQRTRRRQTPAARGGSKSEAAKLRAALRRGQ